MSEDKTEPGFGDPELIDEIANERLAAAYDEPIDYVDTGFLLEENARLKRIIEMMEEEKTELPNVWIKSVHTLAIEKGWWVCPTCNGTGSPTWRGGTRTEPHRVVGGEDRHHRCATCNGTGEHKNVGECIALIHAEASEALEAKRQPWLDSTCDKCPPAGYEPLDIERQRSCQKCNGTGEALGGSRFGEELADVVIRILDLCGAEDIDLGRIIELKHAYNTTRPRRHGKDF